jgi:hypothetical protein
VLFVTIIKQIALYTTLRSLIIVIVLYLPDLFDRAATQLNESLYSLTPVRYTTGTAHLCEIDRDIVRVHVPSHLRYLPAANEYSILSVISRATC